MRLSEFSIFRTEGARFGGLYARDWNWYFCRWCSVHHLLPASILHPGLHAIPLPAQNCQMQQKKLLYGALLRTKGNAEVAEINLKNKCVL